MTLFLVTLFRKFNDKDEIDNDDDDNSKELNTWTNTHFDSKNQSIYHANNAKSIGDDCELQNAKIKQLKINKCHKILREIFFNLLFISALGLLSYSNRNLNMFNYQSHIAKSFVDYKKVSIYYPNLNKFNGYPINEY